MLSIIVHVLFWSNLVGMSLSALLWVAFPYIRSNYLRKDRVGKRTAKLDKTLRDLELFASEKLPKTFTGFGIKTMFFYAVLMAI